MTPGNKGYLFLFDRSHLNPTKFSTQLWLIFNNIFHFRLRKTVSIATAMPSKHIPAFDTKFSFDMQAVSRRNIQAGHTLPTIDASFYAITFFHKLLLNDEPCSHFFFLLLTCLKMQNESQLIKLIRPVWLNGWVFVYELSCCGFESRCSLLKRHYLWTIWTKLLLNWIKAKVI